MCWRQAGELSAGITERRWGLCQRYKESVSVTVCVFQCVCVCVLAVSRQKVGQPAATGQIRSWMFFLNQTHTLSHTDKKKKIILRHFLLLDTPLCCPISTGLQSLILSRWNKNRYGTSSSRQMGATRIFVKWILEWTRSHRHAHWWASTSVSAASRQQKETSGFASSDGSVPLAETPRNLLSPSHMSPFHTHHISFPSILNLLARQLWRKHRSHFHRLWGGCNGKEMVSFPLSPTANAGLSLTGTNAHTYTHTRREKIAVLARQERGKKAPVCSL